MSRPIAQARVEKQPIGYQSVTVRLPYKIIEALNTLDKGKRADFIRVAIEERLQREGIKAAGEESQNKAQ